MKRILLILVGGTICTLSQGGVRSLATSEAQTLLVEHFRESDSPFCGENETEILPGEKFNTLSENMSIETWNRLKKLILWHIAHRFLLFFLQEFKYLFSLSLPTPLWIKKVVMEMRIFKQPWSVSVMESRQMFM